MIRGCRGVLATYGYSHSNKTSGNPKTNTAERPYAIKGFTYDGIAIYTKGKVLKQEEIDVFYILISSKRSTEI